MTLHKIRTMLYLRNIRHQDIANMAGVSRSTVGVVLNGYGKSHKVQKAVADLLNRPFEKLWGADPSHNRILPEKKRVVND